MVIRSMPASESRYLSRGEGICENRSGRPPLAAPLATQATVYKSAHPPIRQQHEKASLPKRDSYRCKDHARDGGFFGTPNIVSWMGSLALFIASAVTVLRSVRWAIKSHAE
jgi:hypothetical protein